MKNMYFVYVIRSTRTRQMYIGFSEDPFERLKQHNDASNASTSRARPWQIVYLEGYLDKRDALGREKFLKGGSGRRYLKKHLKYFFTLAPIA